MQKLISWALTLALSLGLALPCLAAPQVPLLSQQTLKSWLKDPDLMIIDVRLSSYATGKRKIKGAVRQDPDKVKSWGTNLPKDKKIVLYCS
jgi:rhodanese-related sulfurtransferase